MENSVKLKKTKYIIRWYYKELIIGILFLIIALIFGSILSYSYTLEEMTYENYLFFDSSFRMVISFFFMIFLLLGILPFAYIYSEFPISEGSISLKKESNTSPKKFGKESSFDNNLIGVIKGDHVRTYKVGLRVPESLLVGQNALIRRREVLQFLRKNIEGILKKKGILGNFKGFITYKNLFKANNITKDVYKIYFDEYMSLNLKQIKENLIANKSQIDQLKKKNPVLDSQNFSRADIPKFADPANPLVNEISVHYYQYLANKSFKLVCAYLNTLAEKFIDKIPAEKDDLIEQTYEKALLKGKRITESSLESFPEMALANLLDRFGNIDQVAFIQMAYAMDAYRNTRDKVSFVRDLLHPKSDTSADFSNIIPILMTFYSVPNHLKVYLAKAWNVDSNWVRNLITGWRRKIDVFLPSKFQIEPLTSFFSELAEFFKKFCKNENEVKIISILQKNHVLHFLSDIDLSTLLPADLKSTYNHLKTKTPKIPSNLMKKLDLISSNLLLDDFSTCADNLIKNVNNNISNLNSNSQGYKNSELFIKKIELIQKYVVLPQFAPLFKYFLPGNKYTNSIVKLFKKTDIIKKSRTTRLFTALRGIAALAFVREYPDATIMFKSAFTPDNCVIRPFKSKKRKKKYLPANLLSPKYVIERKAYPSNKSFLNNDSATKILKNGAPIWLGIPIYSPDQLVDGELRGNRKSLFWFQLIPSKKIVGCLRSGAKLNSIRLNIPRGPTNKIVADLSLSSSKRAAFSHNSAFIGEFNKIYGSKNFPKSDFIGSDFNQIGTNLIALSTPAREVPLKKAPSMMEPYRKAYTKLEKHRKIEIANIQKKLDSSKGSIALRGRWKAQITLLHRRRKNLMEEMKRQALMVYLYSGYRVGAKYFAWDGVQGLSTRGKRGTLATAVIYMPIRKDLFHEFSSWASDLKKQGILSNYMSTEIVSPFTSQVCASCLESTEKMRKSMISGGVYDDVSCKICGKKGDRHINAAQVSALQLKKKFQAVT